MSHENRTTRAAPQPAARVLDAHYLEARCKLLDLAAILDRVGRGAGASELEGDYRMHRIQQALDILLDPSGGRAERIQQIFSDDYDPTWEKPQPR
jgi:hypothetical protein